jgi:hypothetical protein
MKKIAVIVSRKSMDFRSDGSQKRFSEVLEAVKGKWIWVVPTRRGMWQKI